MKWYRGYRLLHSLGEQQGVYDETLKAVRKRFGESAGFSVNISVDGSGNVTRTLRATRECGDIDDSRFLAQVTGELHQVGMPWPDRIEYVYSCEVSKPASLGMMVPVLARAVGEHFKADPQCEDVRSGALTRDAGYWQQSLYVHDGAADMRLYTGAAGDAVRVQVLAWPQLMAADVQHRLLLCVARAMVGALAPEENAEPFEEKFKRVWLDAKTAAASVRVGGYRLDTRAEPLELNLYPAR